MKLTEKDIEKFLTGRGFAEGTQKSHRCRLRPIAKWLGDRDFNEDTVREFAQRYKKPRTRNAFLAVMKSFAGWKMKRLSQEDQTAYIRDRQVLELIRDIRLERVVVRLERKELSMDELRVVFGSLKGVKFSGLWCLAWFGCRPGELVALTLADINKNPDRYLPPSLAKELRPDEYCVKFLTEKTVVERAMFMDEFTKGHLERFIESGRGRKFLWKTCVKLRDKVGVGFMPKWFRSTFQTKMQRRLLEADIPMVKLDLLVKVMSGHTVGHDITSVYTDYGSDIKKAMTELHFLKPLEGKKALSSFNELDTQAILEYVAGNPGTTTKVVSQVLNFGRPTTTRKLTQLADFGYLRRAERRAEGRGRPPAEYYLTERGREKLRKI